MCIHARLVRRAAGTIIAFIFTSVFLLIFTLSPSFQSPTKKKKKSNTDDRGFKKKKKLFLPSRLLVVVVVVVLVFAAHDPTPP